MEYEPLPERRPAPAPAREGDYTAPRKTRPSRPRRPIGRHVWRWAWLYALGLGAAAGVVAAAAIHMPEVDRLADYTPRQITRLFDREGQEVKTYAVEHRVLLAEGEIPERLAQAIIAVEDEHFYQHGGIDLAGVMRAMVENLRAGEITQGASTLTMQLAENLFHTRGRDWKRKIAEALLAVEVEKRYSKEQILTLYCNVVYMGEGNYGMQAAAEHYFGGPVATLDLPSLAVLAGMPQRPNTYNPYRNPQLVVERRNHVLGRMLAAGFIGREEHAAATSAPLLVAQRRPERSGPATYFAEEVRRELEARYGSEKLYDAGLQVQTTLDQRMQAVAETALRRQLLSLDHRRGWRGPLLHLAEEDLETQRLPSWQEDGPAPGEWFEGIVLEVEAHRALVKSGDRRLTLERPGIAWTRKQDIREVLRRGDVAWFRLEPAGEDDEATEGEAAGEPVLFLEQEPKVEGVVLVIESATGAVRAMMGGWDFDRSKFNRATQAHRQVGSAFKPFVFGAALENGFTAADTLLDAPVAFRGADNRMSYSPRNYHRRFWGLITLRRALEKSVNVTSVKLLDLVGVERVIDFARRCGIESELPPYPSLALGSADIVPIELAAAYAAIANQGLYVKPYFVEQVATADGRVLEEHLPQAHKAMDPQVAYVLTHMMEGVIDRGTGASAARLEVALAGKTGTTNEYSDAWFVGFTPRYTILTWVGHDVKKSLGNGMTGASAALPIWKEVVAGGLEDGWLTKQEEFAAPGGVSFATVEYFSGLLAPAGSEGLVRTVREAFLAGTEPTRTWTAADGRIHDLPWYLQQGLYIPKEGERMPGGRAEEAGDEQVGEVAVQ